MAVPDRRVQHAYRTGCRSFLLAVISAVVVLAVGYQGIQTAKVWVGANSGGIMRLFSPFGPYGDIE